MLFYFIVILCYYLLVDEHRSDTSENQDDIVKKPSYKLTKENILLGEKLL